MTKNWYTIKSELYEEINRNRSEKWKVDPSLDDYIYRAFSKSEDFSSEMKKDLIVFVLAKVIHIMGVPFSSSNDSRQKKIDEYCIYYNLFEHFKASLNTPLGNKIYNFTFISNNNYISSQEKRNIVSQIELNFQQLDLVKKFPEYKEVVSNIPKDLFFKNVNVDSLQKEIAVKNGLKKLAKEFALFSDDILKIKDEFSAKVLKSITELRVDSDYSKALSFITEVYDEDVAQKINKYVVSNASFSYLKNQPSIKKLIKLYPQSENIFNNFLNYKKEAEKGSIFIENDKNYIYTPFTINLEALEAKLWKERKLSRTQLADIFTSFCIAWKNQGETIFKYYLNDTKKGKITEIELLFKIDKDEMLISNDIANKFIKETLTEYLELNVEMKNPLNYPLQEKFDKLEMQSDLIAPKISSTLSKIKKF